MAFRVEILPQAFDDLDTIAAYLTRRSSFATAERWFNSMLAAIASLSEMPERCPVVEKSAELDMDVRLLLHGRKNRAYKVYYAVAHETPTTGLVQVFHMRHWSRRKPDVDELEDPMDELTEGE